MFDIFARTLTVTRTTLKRDENCIMKVDAVEHFSIRAIVQTADAEVLLALPEGYRTNETYVLFTDTLIRASLIDASIADIVELDGDKYQVIKIQNWIDSPCSNNHYEAVITKITDAA